MIISPEIKWKVADWSISFKPGKIRKGSLSHILLQYVRFCMFNNSLKSVLVICPQSKYPYLPPNSTSGICAVVSKYMESYIVVVFQSNQHISTYWNKV